MTNGIAWISTAPAHASNLRRLRHSFSETADLNDAIASGLRNMAGEPLPATCFPSEIYGSPGATERDYKLPDLFFAGSFWAVTEAAADVMRQFDLGEGALYPVALFRKDRQTPIAGGFFCLNFGNRRALLLSEQSPRMRHANIRMGGKKGWTPPFVTNDNDICLSAPVLNGPDIWIDDSVGSAFFLSDRLAAALKKAKANKGFFLSRCGIAVA